MLQKSGLGNWAGRGGWSGGTLQGKERRQQREADGWQAVPLSEGDHGTFELPRRAQLTVETDAGGIEARATDAGPARLTLEGEDLSNYAVYAVRKGERGGAQLVPHGALRPPPPPGAGRPPGRSPASPCAPPGGASTPGASPAR